MIFKEMDPALVRKALEGHENILASASKRQQEFFKGLSCPVCHQTGVMPFLDTKAPLFKPGELLPSYMARCNSCSHEFDPQSPV